MGWIGGHEYEQKHSLERRQEPARSYRQLLGQSDLEEECSHDGTDRRPPRNTRRRVPPQRIDGRVLQNAHPTKVRAVASESAET